MEFIDFNAVSESLRLLSSNPSYWWIIIPGILIGLFFGATPGLQTSMAMAIFLPFTLYMDFLESLLFLTAIFTGGGFGAGVPAILMNIPGTSSAVSTAFDGYPMARQGKHNEALGYALAASTFGVLLGYVIIFVLIMPLSSLVLKLGPTEMLVVVLWGLTLIASLAGQYMVRGLISGLVGLLIGTIGFSEAGIIRGTMGIDLLLDGVPVIPAMMGMFAASELLRLTNSKFLIKDKEQRKVNFSKIMKGFFNTFKHKKILFRGSFIGIIIGAVPGVGSSVSNLLSYIQTKKSDKDPESFGQGNPKGVVASESANSSSEAGSMATLLALGIPGGGATAVMLAAFAMHNITGGPSFIRNNLDIVYSIIFANFVQVIALVIIGLICLPILASIVKIKMNYLIPSVLALAVFGAFGLSGNMSGPITVLIFAALGWLLKKYHFSVPAMVIGMILGRMSESALVHSLQISGERFSYILERPITITILILLLLSLFGSKLLKKFKAK